MGVHICIVDEEFRDHPDWDSIRYSGDRDLAILITQLPAAVGVSDRGFEEPRLRPADPQVWRDAFLAQDWPNPRRPLELLKLLEDNPRYGVHLSW